MLYYSFKFENIGAAYISVVTTCSISKVQQNMFSSLWYDCGGLENDLRLETCRDKYAQLDLESVLIGGCFIIEVVMSHSVPGTVHFTPWMLLWIAVWNPILPVSNINKPLRTECILHGYTVHQQCWTLLLPTDAHNVKKHRVIKTF